MGSGTKNRVKSFGHKKALSQFSGTVVRALWAVLSAVPAGVASENGSQGKHVGTGSQPVQSKTVNKALCSRVEQRSALMRRDQRLGLQRPSISCWPRPARPATMQCCVEPTTVSTSTTGLTVQPVRSRFPATRSVDEFCKLSFLG